MSQFGVQDFLESFLKIARSPGSAETITGEEVEPVSPNFSGQVFKLQANMDPKHRDKVLLPPPPLPHPRESTSSSSFSPYESHDALLRVNYQTKGLLLRIHIRQPLSRLIRVAGGICPRLVWKVRKGDEAAGAAAALTSLLCRLRRRPGAKKAPLAALMLDSQQVFVRVLLPCRRLRGRGGWSLQAAHRR